MRKLFRKVFDVRLSLGLAIFILGIGDIKSQNSNNHEVFTHINNSLLLSGETLYFTSYLRESDSGGLVRGHHILYVELVNEQGEAVSQQKIDLDNGMAYSDIFIPSKMKTGYYRLVAYTLQMKSLGNLSIIPLRIVNPFFPQEVTESEVENVLVNLMPVGGHLIPGKINKIVFELNPRFVSGMIIDSEKNQIASFTPDLFGLGLFEMLPEIGVEYVVVLKGADGKEERKPFLVTFKETSSILVQKGTVTYGFQVVGSSETHVLKLRRRSGELISSFHIEGNGEASIAFDQLKPGIHSVILEDLSGTLIAERWFLHEPDLDLNIASSKKYPTSSSITYTADLDVNQGANVSISVRKIDSLSSLEQYIPAITSYPLLGSSITSHEDLIWKLSTLSDSRRFDIINALLNNQLDSVDQTYTSRLYNSFENSGELVSGKITNSSGVGVNTMFVSTLATINGQNIWKVHESSGDGNFEFFLPVTSLDSKLYLSILNNDSENFRIDLDNPFIENYPESERKFSWKADSVSNATIKRRSIRNQIENAYTDFMNNQNYSGISVNDFKVAYTKVYDLDDFNRFPKVKDSFVEYISEVSTFRQKIDVRMRYYIPGVTFDQPSLTLVDGIPYNHDRILEWKANTIKNIGIIDNRYFVGPATFDGVIELRSFDPWKTNYDLEENQFVFDYQPFEFKKKYFFEDFNPTEFGSNFPDLRYQLVWVPEKVLEKDKALEISMFTSSIPGAYEVIIQGVWEDGRPLNHREIINLEIKN